MLKINKLRDRRGTKMGASNLTPYLQSHCYSSHLLAQGVQVPVPVAPLPLPSQQPEGEELVIDEIRIAFLGDEILLKKSQPHRDDRLIEWPRGREEYLTHHVSFGAREEKSGIRATLDMGAQGCLHILVSILGNLLELVDGYQTRLVGCSQVTEDLIKGRRGNRTVSKSYSPHRIAIDVK